MKKEELVLGTLAVILVGAAVVSQYGIETGVIVIGISALVAGVVMRRKKE